MLHPDPEDENQEEVDDDLQDIGADGDQADEDGAFDDADEDDTEFHGDNGHQEEPMEES